MVTKREATLQTRSKILSLDGLFGGGEVNPLGKGTDSSLWGNAFRHDHREILRLPSTVDLYELTGRCQGVDDPLSALKFYLSDSMSIRSTQQGHFSDKEFENQAPLLAGATRADVGSEPPHNSTC